MLSFVFKIGEERVELANVHNAMLRKSFKDLSSSLHTHLATMTCGAHQRGPIITLHNDGSQAVLAGLGSCCEELNQRVIATLKDLGYNTESLSSMTRITRYSM